MGIDHRSRSLVIFSFEKRKSKGTKIAIEGVNFGSDGSQGTNRESFRRSKSSRILLEITSLVILSIPFEQRLALFSERVIATSLPKNVTYARIKTARVADARHLRQLDVVTRSSINYKVKSINKPKKLVCRALGDDQTREISICSMLDII